MDTAIIITDQITFEGVYIRSEDSDRIWVTDDLQSEEEIGISKDDIKSIIRAESSK